MNRKDELLAYLLKREGVARQPDYTIPRRDNDNVSAPLSFAQERFWFLDQFEHAHPVYNGCKVVRLIGQPSIDVLVECLNLIVRRHEVLRTTYPSSDGRPIQRISAACSIEILVKNLGHSSESDLPGAIERLVRNEWSRPINLSNELPIRARLVRIDHARNLLILTLHQIAFDSRSVAIFFRELWTAYKAKLHGKEPELPALPVQYGDFASWQRCRVTEETFQSHREYWLQRLSGTLPVLNLPTDKSRPPVQGFDGSRLPILLPEALQLKLKELSRQNGVTLFMTLLAAFKILLHRYTTQEDLLIGCPVLNRGLPEIENLLGSFVNTLVLRTNYGGNLTFRQALRRVRETCVGAFAHQDFPFEKLVEELQPQRDLARNPIFQVMFGFQNTAVPALELPNLRSETVEIDGGMTKFDLTLSLTDKEHGIAGHIEYSTDLFHRNTIERMARHFQILLEGIAVDPDRSIATLPLLTKPERRQILFEWNDTVADYPKDRCLHELFEEQVARTPDAVALKYQDKQLTYRELNRKANQLAHYLVNLGIGPETRVGICVERSIEMVVGLLGILKAGGAYVPLDPSYPTERLRFMLEDADVSLSVTQENLLGLTQNSTRAVCLDRDWPLIAQQGDSNPNSRIECRNLAYVIYTSGSSGWPKGVQIEHRSVVNCLSSIGLSIGLSQHDNWLAVTTMSFDIAALELYLSLIRGAKVTLASIDERSDSAQLLTRIQESGATIMQATPSLWNMLLENGWENQHNLKILCGGEALSWELAAKLLGNGNSVWNLYGPTESTIWSTIHRVESGERSVPIGRPIANTRAYILDSDLQPVPIGTPGELYIGGDGAARGYLNRAELTAERFIGNPFSDDANARLYRTGDRAKYLADGNIEFLGRLDNQIKIRGHRIEPSEIEAALTRHPAVSHAAVVAFDEPACEIKNERFDQAGSPSSQSKVQGPSSDVRLSAYIVPVTISPSVADLRKYLKENLPEYMIPSWFEFLDGLPLTPNGKIDRNALPAPQAERRSLDRSFIEPRSVIEELVAQIWREVLKLDRIGIHDNFFELGGHSLLATRIAARLRANFNIELPLRKLFELPTIAELAAHIEVVSRSESGVLVPTIVPVPRDRPIPASFSQRRLWFLRQLDPQATAYNVFNSFLILGLLDVAALEEAINEVVARHEILRTVFDELSGSPVQRILPSLRLSLSSDDLTGLEEEERGRKTRELALAELRRPFDLAIGPLLRFRLVLLGSDHYVLFICADHVVLDGWSLGIFYKEIGTAYDSCLKSETPIFPPLAVQYADYAFWQHETVKGNFVEGQLDYWKKELAAPLASLPLPTDRIRPSPQTSQSGRLVRSLSRELTQSLKQLSRRAGATLFMTLIATWKVLLGRWAGVEDVIVGSTIAGRGHPETEGLIGFFINALPLRSDLSGNPSFMDVVQRVRAVCLGAYTHQDVPFEMIVEAANPSRDLGRNPLFQVLFNFADVTDRVLRLRGCQITKEWLVDPDAKFDLTLYAPEREESIELAIVYNADLFESERIAAMLDQHAHLLASIVAEPEKLIPQYDLVTPEAKVVLPDPVALLDTEWPGPIHEMFSEQSERIPNGLALSDVLGNWTYLELEKASNQLANYLIAKGIKAKDRIAVYGHRDASLAVALMGVLKAGGVFTILDPAYPAERLISYLRIAQPQGWVQAQAASEPSESIELCLETLGINCRLILPQEKEEISDRLQHCSETKPAIELSAKSPAYIAFTSGSTGEPKAVLCRHGPVTHFLPWQNGAFDLREDDRFALLSGLAYNHLHRDVFTPVAMGASLYVPPPEIVREPVQLYEWLRVNSITVLHITPALGQLLLTAGSKTLPAVRRIFFGGDVLTHGEVARIRELAPNAIIGCFYGATETQRAVGYYEIPRDLAATAADAAKPIPLGRGIKDVQLLLLNSNGQLAGIGELAELYVRSPHLAAGYVGDEELTSEKFVPNPFTNVPNDRLYRTGELGRYLPDGKVEWAGRTDRRVNIRGFRIELEEIESVLKQHPIVKDAAVVVQRYEILSFENSKPETQNPKPDQRLVAYVAAEQAEQSVADLLQSYVSTHLPEYMVPAHIVVSEQLPLSPNGKVDYQALPPLHDYLREPTRPTIAPLSEVESKLAAIFCQVLGREQVGIGENFFRLGGHSLLAAQASARIREVFGVGIELRTFLMSATVSALAKHIELRIRPADTTLSADNTDREEIEL